MTLNEIRTNKTLALRRAFGGIRIAQLVDGYHQWSRS